MSSNNDNDNDNDNSSNSNNSKEDKKVRAEEEWKLSRRFMNVLERKLDQIENLSSSSSTRKIFELEDAERTALYEINNTGLLQGTAAGILSFVVLRRVRSGFLNRLRNQQYNATNPFGFGSAGRSTTTTGNTKMKSPFQQQTTTTTAKATPPPSSSGATKTVTDFTGQMVENREPGTFFNIMTLFIDGVISFYIAVFVSVRNPDKIFKKMANLPLIEGKSVIADTFCPEFLHELREIKKESTQIQKEALQQPQIYTLKALLQFCGNCQQRRAYENLLRQQRGLSSDEPVSIPPPGVPHNDLGEFALEENTDNNFNDTPTDTNSNTNTSIWGSDEVSSSSSSSSTSQQQHEQSSSLPEFYDPSQEHDGNSTAADDDDPTSSWTPDPFVTDQEEQQPKKKKKDNNWWN